MAEEEHSGQGSSTLSIGQAEFQRLQTQLIELRTTNYELKEQQIKLNGEISRQKETVQSQARDLEKAVKTIQRSKKAKEFQVLVDENDNLQKKMESQEEDFRLQNRTFMEELSKVCDENDQLKSDISELRSSSTSHGELGKGGEGDSEELTHFRAENTALQKSLQALQEKFRGESGTDGGSIEEGSSSSDPKVLDLEVKLATMEEEKRMLKARLEEAQESAHKEQIHLQSELDKWMEKAKKKQDSLVQLQEEKEKLFHESRAAFDEMIRSKDRDVQALRDQIQALKGDMSARSEANTSNEEIAKQLESLSTEKEELSLKCSALLQDKESLVGKNTEMKSLLDELGGELQQTKAEVGEQRKLCADLRTELEEAKLSQEQLADQVVKTSEEKFNLMKELESARKLAEKRKTLLDEMAIKGQESVGEQMRRVEGMEERYKEETRRLEQALQEEQARVRKLTEVNNETHELKGRMKSLEEAQQTSEAKISELESSLAEQRQQEQTSLERTRQEHEVQVNSLQAEVDSLSEEVRRHRERSEELEQAAEDRQEKAKIVEKKSNSMLKDLKRQLQQMHKREERLQEQIAEQRGGQALELMFNSPAPASREDSLSKHSRESSLSSLRGLLSSTDGQTSTGATAVTVASPTTSLGTPSGVQVIAPLVGVADETKELLGRVAGLQQEKWLLEEKVNHLESTGSALAEDVIQKSEIIKSYFMENKADHSPVAVKHFSMVDKMSPKRLVQLGRKEERLSEINRKMQRALEESLMKNIHLQENIDMLSLELEKHTKVKSVPEHRPADLQPSDTPEVPPTGPAQKLPPTAPSLLDSKLTEQKTE